MMMKDVMVKQHSTIEDFESLHKQWNALLEKSRSNTIFLTWEWLYAWWCHFGADRTLNIVTVRDPAGRLIGIGPFCITKRSGWLNPRLLTFLGTTRVSSEYLDIIAEPGCEQEVVEAICGLLFDAGDSFDAAMLSDLLDSSLVMRRVKDWARAHQHVVEQSPCQICPYVVLPESAEEFLKALRPAMRSNLKRGTRQIEQMGVEFSSVETIEDLKAALGALFELHQKRWNARGRDGNLKDAAIRAFHVQVAPQLFEHGWLRLYHLKTGHDRIASLYAFRYAKTLYYYQAGFDPEWARFSPGTVLMGKTIEDAISNGLTEYDYLRGEEAYKTRWTKQHRKTYRLTVIPRRHRVVLIGYRLQKLVVTVKQHVKPFIRNAGLLRRG